MNICGLHMFVEHVVQNKVEAAYARRTYSSGGGCAWTIGPPTLRASAA